MIGTYRFIVEGQEGIHHPELSAADFLKLFKALPKSPAVWKTQGNGEGVFRITLAEARELYEDMGELEAGENSSVELDRSYPTDPRDPMAHNTLRSVFDALKPFFRQVLGYPAITEPKTAA